MNNNMNLPSKLNQHQVNKKIMAKDRNRINEWMEYTTKLYRDERLKVYAQKKTDFLNTARHYHNINKLTMMTNRTKLEHHYREMNFPFLEGEPEPEIKKPDKFDSVQLLRTRHLRKAQEETPVDLPTCTVEPWFKRYVSLGKFINAARKAILKRRLLKNLELLKQVNDNNIANFETEAKICDNVSYGDVFQKFLDAPSDKSKPSYIETQSEEDKVEATQEQNHHSISDYVPQHIESNSQVEIDHPVYNNWKPC